MYVIFPADEVVYLSYGRLIYIPALQPDGSQTENSLRVNRLLDNSCSSPSVPSTSSSTRSYHSVPSSVSENKSNNSQNEPTTNCVIETPIKPERKKKKVSIPNTNVNAENKRGSSTSQQLDPISVKKLNSERTKEKVITKGSPKLANCVGRGPNQEQTENKVTPLSSSNRKGLSCDQTENKFFPSNTPATVRKVSNCSQLEKKSPSSNSERKSSNSEQTESPQEVSTTLNKSNSEQTQINLEIDQNPKVEEVSSNFLVPRINLARSLDKEKSFVPQHEEFQLKQPQPRRHRAQNFFIDTKILPKVNREKSSKVSEKSFIELENNPVNSLRAKRECEYLSVGEEKCNKISIRESSPNSKSKDNSSSLETRILLTNFKQLTPEKTPPTKRNFFGNVRGKRVLESTIKMAATESPLRDLTHPSYNETLKAHNAVAFKLVKTVSDFTQQLGQFYEHHAEELQLLVSNFKKKNLELRKERPACPSSLFHTWETLLQEVEIDSQTLGEVASILSRQISRPLLEKSFCRKIQSRKVFTHRESYETIVAKTEEKLAKCRQEYKTAYLSYLSTPTTESLSAYFNNHNAYVQQLHATNGMLEEYGKETLPQLLQELDEIYSDICSSVSDAILQGAEVVSSRAGEKQKRYESLINQCRLVSGASDLANLARSLPAPQGRGLSTKRPFIAPQPPPPELADGIDPSEIPNDNIPPPLKDELVIDRLSAVQVLPAHDALRKESIDLEAQIRQIHDSLETLLRIQQRSLESALYNKANELQEDISLKKFDFRVAQIHLSAINSQKELFLHKLEGTESNRERKMSTVSTGSMKTKWLKAFKSLKTPPPTASPKEVEKKNGSAAARDIPRSDPDAHVFLENTYKKITPCDVCSQILRGHTRQGLKCRFCKMNVHVDCQDKAPKCQPKSRLLRRQKSTSEIESRVPEATVEEEKGTEVDQIYQVLKQAGEISNNKPRVNLEPIPPIGITVVDKGAQGSAPGSSGSSGQSLNRKGVPPPPQVQRAQGSNLTVNNPPCSTSSDRRRGYIERVPGTSAAENSSMRRRIFAGMKSLTGFGSRSRQGSPGHRSISLPETPHSPRRQKLNLRMKSLSLDSPESTEHVQRRRHHGVTTTSEPHSKESSSSRIQSRSRPLYNFIARKSIKARSTPSSPVHNRRLLSAKNIRMSSVELPDDNDKSPSSASTSPCPSPVGAKKAHRLLPTNLYVVLYNFKSRHQDELDLKAGDKVTVIDFADPDWWKGKCLGKTGYFPSKYCSKLAAGEKPLQVTYNLQLSDGDNGLMLLRDQIVIQIGEEIDGMVMIRSGDNRQGVCPVKFLQEV